MKTNRLKLFVLGLCLVNISGIARAELATDSPAVLTGTVVNASDKVVTLKLSDGRTTKKIPRKFFPKNTDYYPGRILNLNVTEEIRIALSAGPAAKDISDAELIKMIKALHGASGKNVGKKKGRTSALDFLNISSAYAANGYDCSPIGKYGTPMARGKTIENKGCTWDAPAACTDPSAALEAAKLATPAAKTFASCSPILYGTDLCAPGEGETATDEARCGPMHSKRCEGLSDDACIRKFVLPYAQKNKAAVEAYFKRVLETCNTEGGPNPNVDVTDCEDVKTIAGITQAQVDKIVKDYETNKTNERSTKSCILSADITNKDLGDKDNKPETEARFTTVGGSMCGGQKLCVRDIVCKVSADAADDAPGLKRFARCRVENCNSAQACLDDTMVGGSGKKTAVPGAIAPATTTEAK